MNIFHRNLQNSKMDTINNYTVLKCLPFAETETGTDGKPLVLDLREMEPEKLLGSLSQLASAVSDEGVAQIWMGLEKDGFLELKGRLWRSLQQLQLPQRTLAVGKITRQNPGVPKDKAVSIGFQGGNSMAFSARKLAPKFAR